jgi:hypothetical protein
MYLEELATAAVRSRAWKYRVERQTNAERSIPFGQLAAHVAFTRVGPVAPQARRLAVAPRARSRRPAQRRARSTPYDKTELNVAPGQLVEVVFTNPDDAAQLRAWRAWFAQRDWRGGRQTGDVSK